MSQIESNYYHHFRKLLNDKWKASHPILTQTTSPLCIFLTIIPMNNGERCPKLFGKLIRNMVAKDTACATERSPNKLRV